MYYYFNLNVIDGICDNQRPSLFRQAAVPSVFDTGRFGETQSRDVRLSFSCPLWEKRYQHCTDLWCHRIGLRWSQTFLLCLGCFLNCVTCLWFVFLGRPRNHNYNWSQNGLVYVYVHFVTRKVTTGLFVHLTKKSDALKQTTSKCKQCVGLSSLLSLILL